MFKNICFYLFFIELHNQINEYNIDCAKDTYINNDYINNPNIFWITFRV